MNSRRSLLAILLALVPVAAAAQPGMPPDAPDSWDVAGTAKIFCSAMFVSGRDSAEERAHMTSYFLGVKVDSITAIDIDRKRRLVRLTVGPVTREAKQYGDQGCVIHHPGRDSVFFKPVRVATALPDAATLPWPMGDRTGQTANERANENAIDTAKVRQAVDAAFANPAGLTAAFLVVYRGRIIAERYAQGANRDMQLESWSMGKSIMGTLIGRLIQMGALTLEQPAPVAEWHKTADDPRAKIRVMDLMRMSSGLRFSRGSPDDLPGYHDHDLVYTGAIDAYDFSATRPPQYPPNTRGKYRNDNVMLLGLIARDAIRKRGEDYLTWPQKNLFDKIGIRRQVLETDPYGNFLISGYDYGTARNWARLGMLYLNDGVWNGERLLPEGFVKFVSTPAPAWPDSAYGGMVWVNAGGAWRNLPRDAFAFRGAGGQDTYIIPSKQMVIVRLGHYPGSRIGGQDLERAQKLLMEAVPDPTAALLAELIRVNSSNPPGNVKGIAELLAPRFRAAGFEVHVIQTPDTGKTHFIARLRGDGSKRPVLLAAHSDVVGVEREKWTLDPFAGVIRDGYIYGRGAIDFKGGMAVFAQAALMLAERKVPLARDVIFVAEADEEGALPYSARWLAENHWDKIDAEFALNEGGWIMTHPDGRVRYVSISTADKSSANITLTARGTSTHSSMPLPDNAIYALGKALARLAAYETPVTLTPATRQFFQALARTSTGEMAQAFRDLTSDDPRLQERASRSISRDPLLHAIMRNTLAPVLMNAGFRGNVIPGSAQVTINARMVPGSSVDDLESEVRRIVADPMIDVAGTGGGTAGAQVSPDSGALYDALVKSAKHQWPEAEVTPYLFQAGTDAGAWRARGIPVYGIYPYPLSGEDLMRMHGNDERVSVASLRQGTEMIYRVLADVAGRR